MADIRALKEEMIILESAITALSEHGFNYDLPLTILGAELEKRTVELRVIEEGTDLRTQAMLEANADKSSPYSYPHSTRKEMVKFLLEHDTHNASYSDVGISWNIKVRGNVDPIMDGTYELDAAFDEKWDAYLEENSADIFEEACNSALQKFTSGIYQAAGDDSGNVARFNVCGRSGGHLVLTDLQFNDVFMGKKVRPLRHMLTRDEEDNAEWLRQDISNDHLVALYNLVRSVDVDTADPVREIRHEISFIRETKEQEWAAEAGFKP